jgi:hypothetical protein
MGYSMAWLGPTRVGPVSGAVSDRVSDLRLAVASGSFGRRFGTLPRGVSASESLTPGIRTCELALGKGPKSLIRMR